MIVGLFSPFNLGPKRPQCPPTLQALMFSQGTRQFEQFNCCFQCDVSIRWFGRQFCKRGALVSSIIRAPICTSGLASPHLAGDPVCHASPASPSNGPCSSFLRATPQRERVQRSLTTHYGRGVIKAPPHFYLFPISICRRRSHQIPVSISAVKE